MRIINYFLRISRSYCSSFQKEIVILPLDEIYKEKMPLFMFRHASSDIQ